MKVKLQDVLLALEEACNDEISCCYSINKEKIVFFSEYFDDDEEEYDEDDDYIRLPDSYDINEYRMMENFVYSLPKGKNQTILYNAIQGRGAFRRFKDKLHEIGMANEWYKYRDQQYKEIALEWCEENDIEVIE